MSEMLPALLLGTGGPEAHRGICVCLLSKTLNAYTLLSLVPEFRNTPIPLLRKFQFSTKSHHIIKKFQYPL